MKTQNQNLKWYNISFIAFTSMWSINNIFNNYSQQGIHAIFSWILTILFYLFPYLFIVNRLGTAFPNSDGGVNTWVNQTINAKTAYLASWTYWAVNIAYLAQKPQTILVSLMWLFTGKANAVNQLPSTMIAGFSIGILLFFVWLALKGIHVLSLIGNIAGITLLLISIILIGLSFAAIFILHLPAASPHLNNVQTYFPRFTPAYFTTLSMLIFAVGGTEKISPYIGNLKNGKREFPKSMLLLALLVGGSAILGTFSLSFLFNDQAIPQDLMMNGAYMAFQKLGRIFHLGNSLMILYAISNVLSQIAALIISIDAPARILFAKNNQRFIPRILMKRNAHGAPIGGYFLTVILSAILVIIPTLKIKNASNFYNWLLNLNSVVIPFKFLFIFLAFIFLIKHLSIHRWKKFSQLFLGIWIFSITLIVSILGMLPKNIETFSSNWWFQFALNLATPIILGGLGIILPVIKKRIK
ncbi:APC family permease [Ligilactobacillus aviarius]|uniref:Transporter n=1 Tax=Ligilactobacillus aviarius TaxID=1606 RepID=A0A179CGV0_9LACO|nr:amino acid permease [Ligilactobacillus aviarius]OAQ00260.1 transporter [Ligilactobacillus aviarius]OAQ04800.1 transporter [Ligilactobacillus aviarius]OAQ08436.1 transporter [Ligilactobacillus aviarius]OAQ08815.1 transporter [Ligilactobacillus aviarius]OAS76939.1 transporter [Ligilactobacillus aviarius]